MKSFGRNFASCGIPIEGNLLRYIALFDRLLHERLGSTDIKGITNSESSIAFVVVSWEESQSFFEYSQI